MDNSADKIWNVPNRITLARLVLSLFLFALIPAGWYWSALVVFVLAAATDWVDGWWARKFGLVSKLGRILDPFCDKILICGAFILLAESMANPTFAFPWYGRITGWMAVIVVGRELLVTALRGLIEQSGGDFSAKMAGKLKMWFQCIAAGACLLALHWKAQSPESLAPAWLLIVLVVSVWLALLSTVTSGADYVVAASKYFSPKNR